MGIYRGIGKTMKTFFDSTSGLGFRGFRVEGGTEQILPVSCSLRVKGFGVGLSLIHEF